MGPQLIIGERRGAGVKSLMERGQTEGELRKDKIWHTGIHY